MYQLIKITVMGVEQQLIQRKNPDGTITCFLFANDNTDYTRFKKEINADEAQLEDADGNLMTPEEAKAYVATLP